MLRNSIIVATILFSSLLFLAKDILLAFRAGIANRIDPEQGQGWL